MAVFARVVVGVDGTDWGFETLRQALALAPADSRLEGRHGASHEPGGTHRLHAAHWVGVLGEEVKGARNAGRNHPGRSCRLLHANRQRNTASGTAAGA
jgi:hypothetical protein